jgi:UDP-2,4-diacetamido-2,4,6-trideoxy-beta-L-altropyranose hydrolase
LKKFVFRVDASVDIGTGHVMRCVTLADALHAEGAECHFVCREHPGHLMDHVARRGHVVHALPMTSPEVVLQEDEAPTPTYSSWLGADWRADASECQIFLRAIRPDWLVVDHYALDARWEAFLRPTCQRVAVVDDLVDRAHDCELLLDQTLGRRPEDYAALVPRRCTLLTGAVHALLRPDFMQLRDYSLARRQANTLERLLVSMGGTDRDNATGRVLQALERSSLPSHCRITVVMGGTAPWLDSVRQQATAMTRRTEVLVEVSNMAQLMADSDLSIGAAGSTSWERCCLGVPTLMLVLAANQRDGASALERAGAAIVLGHAAEAAARIEQSLARLLDGRRLRDMSLAASRVTDGRGTETVARQLLSPA